nr:Uma2 family endonuclease [Hoyosella altamirensis]
MRPRWQRGRHPASIGGCARGRDRFGSLSTDYRLKHDEYADAGIPNYWIVDLNEPVSLVVCHLAGSSVSKMRPRSMAFTRLLSRLVRRST